MTVKNMIIKNAILSNCNGCYYGYDDSESLICIFALIGHDPELVKECPCKICIVKVVCSKRCGEFVKFLNSNSSDSSDGNNQYSLREGLIVK